MQCGELVPEIVISDRNISRYAYVYVNVYVCVCIYVCVCVGVEQLNLLSDNSLADDATCDTAAVLFDRFGFLFCFTLLFCFMVLFIVLFHLI